MHVSLPSNASSEKCQMGVSIAMENTHSADLELEYKSE